MMPKHHYHRIHARLRSATSFPDGSLSPAQILEGYGFKQNMYAGAAPIVLGIGSLGGGVVQPDIDNEVQAWGMLAPDLTVRTVGGAKNDPSDQDSNVENMLDILCHAFTWWFLTGTAAKLVICFGPNASDGMAQVTSDLVTAGCKVCSWSWGGPSDQWDPSERATLAQALADAVSQGVIFTAASGDNSIDDGTGSPTPDYPCSDPNAWAVGGTKLVLTSSNAWESELAWGDGAPGDEGGGGGYDPTVPVPAWQKGIIPVNAPGRGVPDSSANADPNSGWQMSANGGWTVVGGTSAAAPFTAALIGVARGLAAAAGQAAAPSGVAMTAIYGAPTTACRDITLGSDGDAATPGWDPATGLGSPNGDAFIQALVKLFVGATTPVQPAPPGTQPSAALAVQLATQGIENGDPIQTRSQAVANAAGAINAGWPTS